MNKEEYKHKKRECWLDTANYCGFTPTNSTILSAFNSAFDLAYALGKQTETITQEEIEKAWQKYAQEIGLPDSLNYATKPMIEIAIKQAFKAGTSLTLGKQEKDAETVIQGWVCRDKYWQKDIFPSDLFLAMEKPKRNEEWKTWTDLGAYIPLNTQLFPDHTWDSDPIEVELIIKRKKK